ncbi:IgGFc-binding protein-like [Siniperca chuatsi]|uniref:IgGFc-binding protein-like n=1 Tax=Siniperca chuatsi TaxID=119488 RepID=UPI001CE0971C|nr:IgGFc-binding protein-like [Siniperca chuatsi]
MSVGQLRSSPLTNMGLFVVIFSALLLSGFCRGGPATLTPESGTCWVMGNLHYTFDGHYYTFMGNCTYTMAKNCHVGGTLPAFEVETNNVGNIQVPSVGTVTVNVYGINIDIVRSEFGIVRVNYQQWTLPINLNNGQVKLSQKGVFVVMETDFGLSVQYDWNEYLAVTVPGSFAGSVCGLCGNFNSKKEDDLTTPSGSVASSVAALGESWKAAGAADEAYCHDECVGHCENCPLSEVQKLEKQIFCSALLQDIVELVGCQPEIDSSVFQSNCMLDLCRGEAVNTYLCNTLQGFADICQRSGVKVPNWRTSTKCPTPKCPENSHYEFCGSGCPATCANPNTPTKCNAPCVESCVCNDGFMLSGTKCVPKAQCGCMYEGHYVEAGASLWGGEGCTKRYTCSAGGSLSSKQTSCPAGQQCQVVQGIRGCYPVNYATCMVSGDPHFVTFDGQRYNFQGTCAYQMAAVSSNKTGLEHFSVVLQNNGQDKKIGSVVKLLEVKVYGHTIAISKEHPGAVVVNGELSDLPLMLDSNKLHLYTSGWFAVIETDFGVKVYYDWSSVAFVIVPSTYTGVMQGLCGNYNLNPKDDMQMRNGKQAATSEQLGQSWKVATIPGCVDGCSGPCPGCNATQKATYNSNSYCGLISDSAGPFRDCHSKVDPAGFLDDCLYDVCLYQGSGNMQCKTLTAYTAACQLKGATVYSWRSAQFCDAQCPSNSHYELCTTGCSRSCQTDSTLSNCGAQCMEGYVCDEGYLLSGDECVPATQCGCISEGKYYQHGQVFYPDALCQKECTCNGTVQCKQSSCGPYEKCEIKNYVRSCQPLGKGVCSISGDPHYNTFDNTTYDFQGTCTYIAAKGCHLSGTRLTNFSVAVENEKWYGLSANPKVSVTKLVAVEVYGTILILRRNEANMVWINGVLLHLPQILHNGAVKVYQEGANDVIMTDFGLRVTYDLVYHVTVTVPGNYRGRTCGLCGNFNNNKTDEFQLPDGNVSKDFQTFGAAWKVPVPGVICEDGCSGDLCPKCGDSDKAAIEAKCAIITNPNGPFAACHDVIDSASYFRDCVYDVCLTKDESILCHSIAAYMSDCQDFGAKIQNWRSPSFCPFTCGIGSHYETCVLPCTSPCPGLVDTGTCTTACVEGCACNKGYHYSGTGCVPFDQCSCYYNGQTYKVGESIISDDCLRIHTCQTSGVVLSKNMTCDPNESCLVKNGVMGCYIQQCFLSGNGTLTAFNGEGGTITVPGAYEIIQNCDQSQTSDWFRVVVKLETCTPGVNTITAAYVFFNEVMITVDKKHDVWINGRVMTQTTFSQNNVKVVVSDSTVRINSPSSLQLYFSSANELTMSVSDKVADMVCGACGKLRPVDTTLRDLRERLLVSLHGQSTVFATLNIGQWTAPDFPQCGL